MRSDHLDFGIDREVLACGLDFPEQLFGAAGVDGWIASRGVNSRDVVLAKAVEEILEGGRSCEVDAEKAGAEEEGWWRHCEDLGQGETSK